MQEDHHYATKQKVHEDVKQLLRDVGELVVESTNVAVTKVIEWGHQILQFSVYDAMDELPMMRVLKRVVKQTSEWWVTRTIAAVAQQHQKQDVRMVYYAVAFASMLALAFIFVMTRRKTRSRDRLDSISGPGASSMGMNQRTSTSQRPARDRKGSVDGLFQPQNAIKTTKALGPNVSSISYETWTPPVQWKDASKSLLPTQIKAKPQSKVNLQLPQGTLLIDQVTAVSYDIFKISLLIRRPAESGIVEILHGEESLEHTFQSAYEAAQFQHDILGFKVVGQTLNHLYNALELVHKGSLAYLGSEPVLHHVAGGNAGDAVVKGAVAWDDVMRCLGGTDVRTALERLHVTPDVDMSVLPSLHEDYRDRRALLGPVDLFRLYCPVLPETAIPKVDSHPARMESLLKLRKQVSEAAVLVQAYVLAKQVSNQGWEPWPEQTTLRRRIAFDDDRENAIRDRVAINEYYEATVTRDVQCELQTPHHLTTSIESQQSAYQAFSLVGCQIFQLAKDGHSSPFSHTVDPVVALPSLRDLISNFPEMDFFVSAFFPEKSQFAVVKVFVRSLPKGVDQAFDITWKRFYQGDAALRDRKLEVFTQLGPGAKASPIVWAALRVVSFFLSWFRLSEPVVSFEANVVERTPFPGMNMSKYTETTHFGGALQSNPEMPGNYVAVTSHEDWSNMNMILRILYQKLEKITLPRSTVDFTFVLAGERKDELPERALGTIRMARVNPVDCTLPIDCSGMPSQLLHTFSKCAITPLRRQRSLPLMPSADTVRSTVLSSIKTSISSWNIFSFGNHDEEVEAFLADDPSPAPFRGILDTRDPFKSGVETLAEILEDVQVPVRRAGLTTYENADATSIPDDIYATRSSQCSRKKEELCNLAISKKLTKWDLKRFYLGADCNLMASAVRVVESMAWRGLVFPIDVRECRIELQSGQFFQQGRDYHGNPVFYFQYMCLGPWRKNENAVVNAVLHRLEASIQRYSEEKPDVQCTVVILLGKPVFRITKPRTKNKEGKKKGVDDTSTKKTEADSVYKADDDDEDSNAREDSTSLTPPSLKHANPRLLPGEDYYPHANTKVIAKLIDTLLKHYPERLHRAIIVPGKGGPVQIMWNKYIPSSRTRAKVTHLHRVEELTTFISANEMVTLVGGNAVVHPNAFES